MGRIWGIVLIALVASSAAAEQPLSQEELAKKPPYERKLQPDEAKAVAQLIQKSQTAHIQGRLDEAVKLGEEIIALQTRLQGGDHWEVLNRQVQLDLLRTLHADGWREKDQADQASRQALQLTARGRHDDAEALFRTSLDVYRRVLGEDHPYTANSYWNLASNLRHQRKTAEAERLCGMSLDIYRKTLGENHPNTAKSCNLLAVIIESQGRFTAAQPHLETALEIRRKALGDDHADTAHSYSNLAVNLDRQGKAIAAQPLHERAIEIRRKVLGEDHADTAISYNNLAFHLDEQGKSVAAQPLHEKALEIRRKALGDDHPDTAQSYGNLASNLDRQGKGIAAQPLHEKALAIFRKALGDDHLPTAVGYSKLACNLESQGKAIAAHPLHERSLEIRRKVLGEEHPETASGYAMLATNLEDQDQPAAAQSLHRKALAIRQKSLGEQHRLTAASYNNVGFNLCQQGKTTEAQTFYQKALAIDRKVLGEDHVDTAGKYNNLASLLDKQGKAIAAQPLHEKALEIRRKTLGDDHADTAQSYGNLACNLEMQGKAIAAQPLHERALDICRKVLGEDHKETANKYNNLSSNLLAQKKAAEAQPLQQKAIDIQRKVLGEFHVETAASYINLASILDITGRTDEAAVVLRQAIRSAEASRLNRARGIERAIGTPFINCRLRLAAITHLENATEAWCHVEATLGRGLLDEQGSGRTSATPVEAKSRTEWRARLAAIQPRIVELLSQASRNSEQQAELDGLMQMRTELGERLAELAATVSGREVATNAEIQSAIPAQAALVVWVDVPDVEKHLVCVVCSDGEPFWGTLPGSGEQGAWTKDDTQLPSTLRRALTQQVRHDHVTELIQQLRRQRIEPTLDYLKQRGITRLFVVCVNSMTGIPVEVLAPEFAISYVPSGTYIARLSKKPSFAKTLLAVGDPFYESANAAQLSMRKMPQHGLLIHDTVPDGSAAKAGIRPGDVLLQYGEHTLENVGEFYAAVEKVAAAGHTSVTVVVQCQHGDGKLYEKPIEVASGVLGVVLEEGVSTFAPNDTRQTDAGPHGEESWRDLPGSRFEVSRISEMFPSTLVLLDDQASERRIDALRSGGELGRFSYLHFATHGKADESIAFDSIIVLSQNDTADNFSESSEPWMNNEISAREVLDYWKLNADLVTLSACETGLGTQGSGDGLLGFAQAFLLAGARSVCLSLWEVDDTATALLMQRFYQNLLAKRPGLSQPMRKVDALREAKNWLRNMTTKEALEATATLTGGISRGNRGEITITKRLQADRPDDKPWADPHYWAAFILIGDPE